MTRVLLGVALLLALQALGRWIWKHWSYDRELPSDLLRRSY